MSNELLSLARKNSCANHGKMQVEVHDAIPAFAKKSSITMSAIRDCYNGNLDRTSASAISDYCINSFMESNLFDNNETCKLIGQRTGGEIYRLVNTLDHSNDYNHPLFPSEDIEVELSETLKKTIRPHMFFMFKDGQAETVLSVEIRAGKPDRSQRSVDDGVADDLDLYAMMLYGRKVAEAKYKKGTPVVVKAQVWYLRRSDDRSTVATWHWQDNFFTAGGGNVIGIMENYIVGEHDPHKSLVDLGYLQKVKAYENAGKCDEKDCEKCDLRNVCCYEKSPIPIITDPVVKNFKSYKFHGDQKKAVEACDGIFRVIAKAGTGKTTTIAFHNMMLCRRYGFTPQKILNITFTVPAAQEMKARIAAVDNFIGIKVSENDINAMTFNALGDEIVKREYQKFGFASKPSLLDDEDSRIIIADLLARKKVDGLDYLNFNTDMLQCRGALAVARKVFEIVKRNGFGTNDVYNLKAALGQYWSRFYESDQTLTDLIDRYQEYDEMLKDRNLIDYIDQEILVDEIFKTDPDYLEKLGYEAIIVDEFQDSSPWQVNLVKKFSKTKCCREIMVVGDDQQAIYGFRGTSPEGILNFQQKMGKPVTDFHLTENYRSVPEILEFADNASSYNKLNSGVRFTPVRQSNGIAPVVKGFFEKDSEQKFIVDHVKKCIESGRKPEEIAILTATNDEVDTYMKLLKDAGIRSVSLNPEKMADNSRVQAAIAFVKAMMDRTDTKDLFVYANAKRFGGLLDCTADEQEASIQIADAEVDSIALKQGSEKRDALINLLKTLDMSDEVYEAFLDKLASMDFEHLVEYVLKFEEYGQSNAVRRVKNYPGVVITTAHSSKGLEWPVTFVSLSKFDTQQTEKSDSDIEEHRRLCYVAYTRARDELYVTGQWVAFGNRKGYTFNRYLEEAYHANGQIYPAGTINDTVYKKASKTA